jgi:hypothetical protein
MEWRRENVPATSWDLMKLRKSVREGAACPRARSITVQVLCWCLIGVNTVDGLGMVIGDDLVTSTDTYDVLREIPGGMRTYGVALLVGALALSLAIGFASPDRRSARTTQAVLSFGVGYNLLWLVCIPAAWWHLHKLPTDWPAASKYLLLTLLYFYCARAVAPPRRSSR